MAIPQHISIIMDGNGRWARQRGKNRAEAQKPAPLRTDAHQATLPSAISANTIAKMATVSTMPSAAR